jgi:hypothetical protein
MYPINTKGNEHMSLAKFLVGTFAVGLAAGTLVSPAHAELCFFDWEDEGETFLCDANPSDGSSCEGTTSTSGTTFSTTVELLSGFSARAVPINRFGDEFANPNCASLDQSPADGPGPTRNCSPDVGGEPAVEIKIAC